MDRPRCKTCPYWWWQKEAPNSDDNDPEAEVDGDFDELPGHSNLTTVVDTAECRRRSPATAIEACGDRLHTQPTGVVWPDTDAWEWCGEHPDFPEYIKSLNRKDEAQAITLRQALEEHRATSSEIAGRAFSALCNEEFEFLDMPLAAIEVRQLVNYVPHFGPACGKQFDTWRGRILRQHSRLPGTPPGE